MVGSEVYSAEIKKTEVLMENFRRVFHEPYYRDYISDDIGARLAQPGFEGITAQSHFMTRVWTARKPR